MQTQQFDFESFNYQGELPETLTGGEVYSVRVLVNQRKTKDVPLFIREHLIHQEKLFNQFLAGESFSPYKIDHVRRTLYVTGPPGCGKTVFTTLLAHRYAAGRISSDAEPKRVLMILFRKAVRCEILIIDGQETQRLRHGVKTELIEHKVEAILLDDKRIPSFDLCIVDGIRQAIDECSRLMSTLDAFTGESDSRIGRVVHTTSLQFRIKLGDMEVGYDREYEQINFDSFTEDDYLSAIANREFLERLLQYRPHFMADILHLKENGKIKLQDQDDNNEDPYSDLTVDAFLRNDENFAAASEYIKEKFFYAGGSARFMFELTTLELMETLGKLFMQLDKKDWDAFANSALAPSATSSVNTLMQQLKGYATAVSRYVLFEAYDRVAGDLVKAVQAAADMSENPALIGWAFELRQLHTIKTVLTNNSRLLFFFPKMFLKSKEGLCFRPLKNGEASFDGNKLIKHNNKNLNSGTIIWCMKWNQGCFDFAFFKKQTLMTLQFTIAETHTLKIQFIKDLRNAIEENSSVSVINFIHVGVVGGNDDVLRKFMFQNPEGLGRRSNGTRRDFTLKTYKSSELVIQRSRNESFAATSLGDYEVYTRKREL